MASLHIYCEINSENLGPTKDPLGTEHTLSDTNFFGLAALASRVSMAHPHRFWFERGPPHFLSQDICIPYHTICSMLEKVNSHESAPRSRTLCRSRFPACISSASSPRSASHAAIAACTSRPCSRRWSDALSPVRVESRADSLHAPA